MATETHDRTVVEVDGYVTIVVSLAEDVEVRVSQIAENGYSGMAFWLQPDQAHNLANALLRARNIAMSERRGK